MKILIHIGAHKTGTSSIQLFMHQNHQRLLNRGILYPHSGIRRYGHHALALSCKPSSRSGEKTGLGFDGELEPILREIEAASVEQCVLSSEAFFVTDPEKIQRLASAFSGADIRILAFVRRPDTMFMSIYTNRLKKLKKKADLAKLSYHQYLERPDRLSRDLEFETQIDIWAGVFGRQNIDLRRVEEGDSVDAMMSAIGIDPESPLAADLKDGLPLRGNRARSNEALALLKLAKETLDDEKAVREVWDYCRARLPKTAARSFLSPSERRRIISFFEASNARLFASFGYSFNPYSLENLAIDDDDDFLSLDNQLFAREILDEALGRTGAA
jgi:hypothetical protein